MVLPAEEFRVKWEAASSGFCGRLGAGGPAGRGEVSGGADCLRPGTITSSLFSRSWTSSSDRRVVLEKGWANCIAAARRGRGAGCVDVFWNAVLANWRHVVERLIRGVSGFGVGEGRRCRRCSSTVEFSFSCWRRLVDSFGFVFQRRSAWTVPCSYLGSAFSHAIPVPPSTLPELPPAGNSVTSAKISKIRLLNPPGTLSTVNLSPFPTRHHLEKYSFSSTLFLERWTYLLGSES